MNTEAKEFLPSRELYDTADNHKPKFTAKPGLSEELIKKISQDKNEPEWMLDKRLKGLELFNKTPLPRWGPDLSELKIDEIIYYIDPNAKESKDWKDVPEEIKRTFDKLGIPEAEKNVLAGVGAQYDSNIVYHRLKADLEAKGVIFENMDVALQKYPEMVKKYFMTSCIPIATHKFTMLHAAVWSGGTFIYVPKNVKVELPLQAYFRMNAEKGGQFEHTLIIVDEGAELHYIEGCLGKGTLIATNPDYKPIEEIKSGDRVLTHNGRYKAVKGISTIPYSGDMYQISCYGDATAQIEATFNHPFLWVKRQRRNERNIAWKAEWNIPKYMSKLDYLALPINKTIVSDDYHEYEIVKGNGRHGFKTIRRKVKCDKDFFRLIGYFLSEGSISGGSYVNFSFGEKETRFIEDVERLIKKVFNIKTIRTYHKKNHGVNVIISSVEIARVLSEFGKSCDTKQIPYWMMLENPEKQKELIKGLWYGDGNYYKKMHKSGFNEALRYSTTSERLAKQVRDILLRCKVFGFVNKRDRFNENRKTMYTVGVNGEFMIPLAKILGMKPVESKMHGKKRATRFFIDDNFAYLPIKNITKKSVENCPVYDLSIEDDESFVANFATVHNCSSPRYQQSSLHAGCVEIHVLDNAKMKYTSIENWSKNVYNLNTKRAMVHRDAVMKWVNGQMGSCVTMLYPMSVLIGEGSSSESVGIAFAGPGQNQDTGSKVLHLARNTTSMIDSKSISKGGGIATYRGSIEIRPQATNSRAFMKCNGLILDTISKSDAIPVLKIENSEVEAAHEATVGKIGDEEIFYLMSRGLSNAEAVQMIVSGFIEPITKALPLEYAVELNKLIEIEIEGH
ncbi:SufD family Fe-S cluster assembly protein [Candidatus Woesearchaeota archaeon]|nr:SufD family Fe-S cluster assembly protein [Candidatus Woesearchaeota archaeon]